VHPGDTRRQTFVLFGCRAGFGLGDFGLDEFDGFGDVGVG
jgi:hypothetical protein